MHSAGIIRSTETRSTLA